MQKSLGMFEKLKYKPMKDYLNKRIPGVGGSTTKAQFVQMYKQYLEDSTRYLEERKEVLDTRREYLSTIEVGSQECALPAEADNSIFRQKMRAFEKCLDTDLSCMLKALGLPQEKYSMLLKVNCTNICAMKSDHVPLAIVSDGHVAVGIQHSGGIARIPVGPLPLSKPVVLAPVALLSDIRSVRPLNARRAADAIKQMPNKDIVELRKVDGDLFVAIREAKQRGLRSIRGQASPPTQLVDVSDTSLMGRLKSSLVDIRQATETEDDDDDEDVSDWD